MGKINTRVVHADDVYVASEVGGRTRRHMERRYEIFHSTNVGFRSFLAPEMVTYISLYRLTIDDKSRPTPKEMLTHPSPWIVSVRNKKFIYFEGFVKFGDGKNRSDQKRGMFTSLIPFPSFPHSMF